MPGNDYMSLNFRDWIENHYCCRQVCIWVSSEFQHKHCSDYIIKLNDESITDSGMNNLCVVNHCIMALSFPLCEAPLCHHNPMPITGTISVRFDSQLMSKWMTSLSIKFINLSWILFHFGNIDLIIFKLQYLSDICQQIYTLGSLTMRWQFGSLRATM